MRVPFEGHLLLICCCRDAIQTYFTAHRSQQRHWVNGGQQRQAAHSATEAVTVNDGSGYGQRAAAGSTDSQQRQAAAAVNSGDKRQHSVAVVADSHYTSIRHPSYIRPLSYIPSHIPNPIPYTSYILYPVPYSKSHPISRLPRDMGYWTGFWIWDPRLLWPSLVDGICLT